MLERCNPWKWCLGPKRRRSMMTNKLIDLPTSKSTGKVFDGYIRDIGFNPYLHQKLIDILV